MNEYRDALSLLALWGVVIAIAAWASGGVWAWLRGEVEMLRRDTWDFIEADGRLLTTQDPRCRRMVIRQRSAGVHLRRSGVTPRVAISSASHPSTRFARSQRG